MAASFLLVWLLSDYFLRTFDADVEVIEGGADEFSEERGGDQATANGFGGGGFGVVDGDDTGDAGLVSGGETGEGDEVLVVTVGFGFRVVDAAGAGLPGDAEAFDFGAAAGAFGDAFFEHEADLVGGAGGAGLANGNGAADFEAGAVVVQDAVDEAGFHEDAAVGDGAVGHDLLEGGGGHAVAVAHAREVDGGPFFEGLPAAAGFFADAEAGGGAEAKIAEGFLIGVPAEGAGDFVGADVAGVGEDAPGGLGAEVPLVIVDVSGAEFGGGVGASLAIDGRVGGDFAGIEGACHGDDFHDGAGFVGV